MGCERVYSTENYWTIFMIDGKFQSNPRWVLVEYIDTFSTDDSIVTSYDFIDKTYIYHKENLSFSNRKYDTIDLANVGIHFCWEGYLYNLRIVGIRWEVAVYYCGAEHGTIHYSFNVTESEDRLFRRLLNTFEDNAFVNYFPIVDCEKFRHTSGVIHALYLRTVTRKKRSEYFGAFHDTNYDSIVRLFRMIYELTDLILRNHISPPESQEKARISNTIDLLDVRERFNYWSDKDCCTGHRLIPPPPLPLEYSDNF